MSKTKEHFEQLGKDFFRYGLMAALTQITGLLLLPFLTRALSIDDYGIINTIAVFISLLSILMMMALPSSISRYFNSDDVIKDKPAFVSTLALVVVVFSALILVIIFYSADYISSILFKSSDYALVIKAGSVIAVLNSIIAVFRVLLRMERRIVACNIPNIVYIIVHSCLVIYFVVYLKRGMIYFFYSQITATVFSLILVLFFARKHICLNISPKNLKLSLKYSIPLLPSLLSTWVNSQIDRIMLLWLMGLSGIAIFGAAARIVAIMTFVLTIFHLGWDPYAMIIIKSPQRNEVYRRAFNYFSGIFAVLALAVFAFSPELFKILLPAEYYKGYLIVPWLAGSAILHISSVFTRLGMLVNEKTIGISIASWVGVSLNAAVSYILIRKIGIAGAAVGSFVAELVFTGLLWRFSLKTSDVVFDTGIIISSLLVYISGSLVLLAIISNVNDWIISIILRILCLAISAGIIARRTIDSFAVETLKFLAVNFKKRYIVRV